MAGFVEGLGRGQVSLFPAQLDDYVADDNPVRAVDAFVDGLDLAVPELKSDPTLRGVIDLVWKTAKQPKIDWAFLDAVKFALDMPTVLQSLVALGSGWGEAAIFVAAMLGGMALHALLDRPR